MRDLLIFSMAFMLGCAGSDDQPLVPADPTLDSATTLDAELAGSNDAVDAAAMPPDAGESNHTSEVVDSLGPPDSGVGDAAVQPNDAGEMLDKPDAVGAADSSDAGGIQDTDGSQPEPQTLVMEELAQGFCSADGDIETEHAGYIGAGYVNTENTIGATIEWSVNAASALAVSVTWRFASESQRPATLWVNNVAVTPPLVFDDTGAWDSWVTLSTGVELVAGENQLRLRSDGPDGLPNIDRMEVFGVGISAGECIGPPIGPGPCGCESPAGEWGTVDQTIVVASGEVFDGGCQIYRANPDTLGEGDQSEFQSPVFRLESGATLKNVLLGAPAADGIHLYGDVTLENVHWLDVGEDAMTVKEEGTVNLDCGSATLAEDKIFQINAASTVYISNFTAFDAATFMRQNGDTTFELKAFIDQCDISDVETVFKTDGPTSHVTMTNTRYHNISDVLFQFDGEESNGNSAFSTMINCEEY